MQQILAAREFPEVKPHQSAFHPVGNGSKSPTELGRSSRQRDSGYGSDASPRGAKTQGRRFTFDADGADLELYNADISSDEEVFLELNEPVIGVINECDERDEADREVEKLLSDCHDEHLATQPGVVRRPLAPLPPPDADIDPAALYEPVNRDLCLITMAFDHTFSRTTCRNPFRPIVSRSVGTQTRNPQCQLVQDALNSHKFTTEHERLRPQSISGHTFPLPDVVPVSRDRSVSLPDVGAFHRREQEQHVGRELRRISDDFHSIYLERNRHRQRTRSMDPSLSSRLGVNLPGYWNSLRRFLTSSPIFSQYNGENR